MTQEEKARAYDEALERAKNEWSNNLDNAYKNYRGRLEIIFPELAESEDERIRKAILNYMKKVWGNSQDDVCGVHVEDAIAWLEKQKSVGEIVSRCKNSWYNEGKIQGQIEGLSDEEKYQQGWHDALEKQSEKKSIDKVETKFNAGDWITNGENVWQIDEVKTENYLLIDSEGILFAEEIATIDSEFHLWTIQDARNGDVLSINWHDDDDFCD